MRRSALTQHTAPPPRSLAAALSAVVTILYALVGLEVVDVPGVTDVEPGPAVPLVIAAGAFAVLTVLLAFRPRLAVLVGGIVLDVAVLVGYLVVAPSRHPSFEPWGLSIKAVELVLLGFLVALAVRSVPGARRTPRRPRALQHSH